MINGDGIFFFGCLDQIINSIPAFLLETSLNVRFPVTKFSEIFCILMFASFTGVSYDSVSFCSWFCSDNAVVIVMAVCGNGITIGKCFITVCAVGISAISAGSTGWRGVITSGGVFVRALTSGDCVSNRFFFVIPLIVAIVNCGSCNGFSNL